MPGSLPYPPHIVTCGWRVHFRELTITPPEDNIELPKESFLSPEEQAYEDGAYEPSCLRYCCGLDVVYGGWVGFLNIDQMLAEEGNAFSRKPREAALYNILLFYSS